MASTIISDIDIEENTGTKSPVHKENNDSQTRSVNNTSNANEQATHDDETIGKTGTYCSFVVLFLCILGSLIFQNYVTKHINDSNWTDGCANDFEDSCKSNQAVYRFSFALVILFTTQLLGIYLFSLSYFDRFWAFKIVAFGALLTGFYFAPANVFDGKYSSFLINQ